jgi:hypothetical protein
VKRFPAGSSTPSRSDLDMRLLRGLVHLVFTVGAGSNAQGILSDATPHLWKVARVGPSIAARSSVSTQPFILESP